MSEPKTLTITEFGGPLTRRNTGDINSGLAKYDSSWGYDPYSKPGNLTWMEQPTSILSLAGANSVIGVMKTRASGPQSGSGYVYAIANSGADHLYEVQVNDTATNNPNFDTASAVGRFTATPSPDRSMGMVFFGATEKIFYGDDSRLMTINFAGSSASIIASSGANFTTAVPRPMTTFLGKVYFGNGANIGEIDSTEAVITGAKLSPALPVGVVVKDLDITPDGNYLQITASKNNPTGFQENLGPIPAMSTDSYKFLWNGIDDAATYFEEYGGLGLTASQTFGDKNYSLGFDPHGTAIFSHQQKIATLPQTISPHPTATFSIGNTLGFMTPEFSGDEYRGSSIRL